MDYQPITMQGHNSIKVPGTLSGTKESRNPESWGSWGWSGLFYEHV